MNTAVQSHRPNPVLLLTRDHHLAQELAVIAEDAGVPLIAAASDAQSGGNTLTALLIGCDMPVDACRDAIRECPGAPAAAVGFGPPGISTGDPVPGQRFSLPGEKAELLAFLERTTIPRRRHGDTRVAFAGAQGGLGTSTLAVATARLLVTRQVGVALVDLNPAGGPLPPILGLDGTQVGWAELITALRSVEAGDDSLTGDASRLLDGEATRVGPWTPGTRAKPGPYNWDAVDNDPGYGLSLLSGSRRIAAGTPPRLLREGVAAAGRSVTVSLIDASPGAPAGLGRVAGWCDRLVVLARTDPFGVAALMSLAESLGDSLPVPVTLIWRVRRGWSGQLPKGCSWDKVRDIIVLKDEAGLAEAGRHGALPGDRARGPLARGALDLAVSLGLTAAESAVPGPRQPRSPIPASRHPREVSWPLEQQPAEPFTPTRPPLKGSETRRARRESRPRNGRVGLWSDEW